MTYHALLDRLAQRLWDERRDVTALLYKLTVTRLLLAADERRFVAGSLREVERAVELLRVGEQARETALRDLADAWRLDPDALTLDALVRLVPEPYAHTFSEHLATFRSLAAEIEGAATSYPALARSDIAFVSEQLDELTGVAEPPRAPTTLTTRSTRRRDPPIRRPMVSIRMEASREHDSPIVAEALMSLADNDVSSVGLVPRVRASAHTREPTLRGDHHRREQDVDVAGAVMEPEDQQVAYETTLRTLGQAVPPSLLAFLNER